MLVITRREAEKVLFPTLGITVEVLRIRGNKARLGIEAAAEIPVVRQEISGLKSVDFTTEGSSAEQLSRLHRLVRERLDRAATALNRLHRCAELAGDRETQQHVADVFRELSALERETGEAIEPTAARLPRALVVEDDANERELLGGLLRLSGFDVTLACDGQDALDYLSLHAPPDVVLLDMQMPRCDGPCFVREVRAMDDLRRLRLFAVSGTDPSSLGVATGGAGIVHWFPKPVDPANLVRVVAAELGPGLVPAGEA